jgi:superfamily II DNA or RNA helicase
VAAGRYRIWSRSWRAQALKRQYDLFSGLEEKEEGGGPNGWPDRLEAAFSGAKPVGGFLPIAEGAIAACPGDAFVLIMAATAALLDEQPERGLVFLKRFSKRATAPAEYLLRALALNQIGKRLMARALLEQHGLLSWPVALNAFPGGYAQAPWLRRQYASLLGDETRSPRRAAPTDAKAKKGNASKAKAAPKSVVTPAPRRKPETPAPEACAETKPLARIDIDIPFAMDFDANPLISAMAGVPEDCGDWFDLRERFVHLSLAQGFDELLCVPHLAGVEPLPHQIETVRKVLKMFRGRVLLADEVGLGKTIEACMALKEYALRGMAEQSLVLAPASLVGQWREELETKFGLDFATTYDPLLREDPDAFWAQGRIIASIAVARRREHAERLAQRKFDIVIVDEAHHLRDRSSQGWKLVDALNKRFLLLLSATPVQNDLIELYNLLTLLKPGIFKTQKEFRQAYMTPGKPREPANSERLRELMRSAMIRNTRAVTALKLPRRHAVTLKVEPGAGEARCYRELAEAARRLAAKDAAKRERLSLRHLLSAAGSSPKAAAAAVARVAARNPGDPAWEKLAGKWAGIEESAKEAALLELVARNPAEKKLVFVHSRATLEHLAERLERAGVSFARFDGSLAGPDKDASIAAFRDHASVLLCTQSGGEGRNIQFCNTLINFDVPWNPMEIEQRIGRIDRIGQTREVFVFNLVTRGALEEQVLALLEEKIAMFELVVGEVGAILGGVEEDREFPDLVLDAWLETSEEARRQAFAALGEQLEGARKRYADASALDEKLFGEEFEAA